MIRSSASPIQLILRRCGKLDHAALFMSAYIEKVKKAPGHRQQSDDRELAFMFGSALEGGAVFEGGGQAAICVGRGVVEQAAPELFAEGSDLVVSSKQKLDDHPVVLYRGLVEVRCCTPSRSAVSS